MLWMYAAITGGLSFGVIYLIANHVMQEASSFEFATVFSVLGAVLYLPVLIVSPGLSGTVPVAAVLALAVSGLANTGGVLASNTAIKQGEVSTVTPLVKTQPVFTAVIGAIVLGEALTPLIVVGVLLVTAGGYLVLLRPDAGLLEPVRRLRDSVPARRAVLAGFLFALAAVADRVALAAIPPRVYTFLLLTFMAAAFIGYIVARRPGELGSIRASFQRHTAAYLVVGVLTVVAYYATVTALSRMAASRVVPLLQVQVLVGVVGGYLLFGESSVVRKLVGSILLIAGVVFVV